MTQVYLLYEKNLLLLGDFFHVRGVFETADLARAYRSHLKEIDKRYGKKMEYYIEVSFVYDEKQLKKEGVL